MNDSFTRELPKLPEDAPLIISEKLRILLTELCFRNPLDSKSELLFCFGTHLHPEKQAKAIADFLDVNQVPHVILTGGRATYNDIETPIFIESERVFSLLDKKKYPNVQFHLERESKNTLENVSFALKIFDFSHCSTITFCSHSYSAGRSYLTLRRFLPTAKISQRTFNICLPDSGEEITRDNWHLSSLGISYVWGEFSRIVHYGNRGDIAISEVEHLIRDIKNAC